MIVLQSRSKSTKFGLVDVEIEQPTVYKDIINNLKTTGRVSQHHFEVSAAS